MDTTAQRRTARGQARGGGRALLSAALLSLSLGCESFLPSPDGAPEQGVTRVEPPDPTGCAALLGLGRDLAIPLIVQLRRCGDEPALAWVDGQLREDPPAAAGGGGPARLECQDKQDGR